MNLSAGIFYALAAAFGLGAVTTQAKLVYADGGNAITLIFWRFVISVLVIGVLVLLRRHSFRVKRELRFPVLIIGVIWSGAMVCYLLSVEYISVSLAVLILYSYPMLVLLVSLVSGQVKPSISIMAVFAAAFFGIFLMIGGAPLQLNKLGLTFAFLAAFGATYTFFKGSALAPKLNPIVLTFWINVSGLVIVLPMIVGKYAMPSSLPALLLLSGATICYVIAILCQFQALAKLSAARTAFIFNLEPVISILLAFVFLKEVLTTQQWIGAIIVIALLFCFERISQNKIMTE